jgi:hypothetical protein
MVERAWQAEQFLSWQTGSREREMEEGTRANFISQGHVP